MKFPASFHIELTYEQLAIIKQVLTEEIGRLEALNSKRTTTIQKHIDDLVGTIGEIVYKLEERRSQIKIMDKPKDLPPGAINGLPRTKGL